MNDLFIHFQYSNNNHTNEILTDHLSIKSERVFLKNS